MQESKFDGIPEYNLYEKVDALVLEYVNIRSEIKYYLDRLQGKYGFLKKNIELKDRHKGRRAFVIGNAPSLNQHDLTLLKNELTFMVNRSFTHPDYGVIQPDYHVFVDPKLATGQWPIEYLEEIKRLNPECTLLLNADWYDLKKFQEIKDSMNVYWLKTKMISPLFPKKFKIDLTTLSTSYFVVEQAVTSAIYMGVDEIYLLGVEGDGICQMILGSDSHFSGSDPDYRDSSSFDYARAMFFNSRAIRVWYALTKYSMENEIFIMNLTPRGLIRMTPRGRYEDVLRNDLMM